MQPAADCSQLEEFCLVLKSKLRQPITRNDGDPSTIFLTFLILCASSSRVLAVHATVRRHGPRAIYRPQDSKHTVRQRASPVLCGKCSRLFFSMEKTSRREKKLKRSRKRDVCSVDRKLVLLKLIMRNFSNKLRAGEKKLPNSAKI